MNLIHSNRFNADHALTRDEIMTSCPAAFSAHASPETSERYGFVSTAEAIDILADHGFAPVRAIQKPVRKEKELPFADHMLTFAPLNSLDGTIAGYGNEERGEIVLYNSHNGRSALKLFVGCFRFICSNGIVAGEGFEAKMRHSRLTANSFSDMVIDQAVELPAMLGRIERFKRTEFQCNESLIDFYNKAAALRWERDPEEHSVDFNQERPKGSFANGHTIRDLNKVYRRADLGLDLWKVFNRAQEGLIRGGVSIMSYTEKNPYGKLRSARAVASLSESVRINRQLWDLADALA